MVATTPGLPSGHGIASISLNSSIDPSNRHMDKSIDPLQMCYVIRPTGTHPHLKIIVFDDTMCETYDSPDKNYGRG